MIVTVVQMEQSTLMPIQHAEAVRKIAECSILLELRDMTSRGCRNNLWWQLLEQCFKSRTCVLLRSTGLVLLPNMMLDTF